MKAYLALFSLFKSYKLYIFFHITLLSILIYMFFSIKLINTLYDNFLSYKYGFTPSMALFVDKNKDLNSIIKKISKTNVEFSYKMGAIKRIKETSFSKNNYRSLNMDIDLMGLYFDKKFYTYIGDTNKTKCLIVDIKNINKNWVFYLDECIINKKKVNIQTNYGNIPFKVRKKRGLYRIKTYSLSDEQSTFLYHYLVEIINTFDNINHIGINPPIKIYTRTDNILKNKKRILRDYLGIIFNKNTSFISALVSRDIYKVISWMKKENVFIDINASSFNHHFYVYNDFHNAMRNNIVLTRFDDRIFSGDYKQFIFFYSNENIDFIREDLKNETNMIIKNRNELLKFSNENSSLIKAFMWFFGLFIYLIVLLISIMSLTRFYKKFRNNLLIIRSFNYRVYIYSIYVFFALLVSSIIAYISFFLTKNMINEYMQNYFYPIVEINIINIKEVLIIMAILYIIVLFESKENKDLKNEY